MPAWWKGPKVVTVYDMIYEHFPNFFGKNGINFRKQKRHCMEDADAIISISQTTKEDLQTFYNINKNRIWVAPPACSDTFMKSGSIESSGINIMTQKPFLLYVGIRTHYKNTDLVIKAYSQWHYNRKIDFVIAGRPWRYDQINELKTLGIKDKVHILGYVDDNTLAQLYRKAVAFIFPSLYEGFGIPLLEAMACGCPIIASDIPSTREVAGDCPIYFIPTEMDDLLNAFEIVLTEGRNSARVEKGFERIRHYSWDKAAQQTLEVYRSL
jgi:glycosyltransferase involved in cell wall biosynthesis